MLTSLLFLAVVFLIIGLIFKVSFNLIRLCLGVIGVILILVLIPIGFALIVPFALLFILVGFLKLIF